MPPICLPARLLPPTLNSAFPQCIARKVPELCQPYTPGKSDQDLAARLTRVEQVIQAALPQHWSATHSGHSSDANNERTESHSPGADDDRGSQADDEDVGAGIYESGSWFGTSASGSVAAPAMLEKVCSPTRPSYLFPLIPVVTIPVAAHGGIPAQQ